MASEVNNVQPTDYRVSVEPNPGSSADSNKAFRYSVTKTLPRPATSSEQLAGSTETVFGRITTGFACSRQQAQRDAEAVIDNLLNPHNYVDYVYPNPESEAQRPAYERYLAFQKAKGREIDQCWDYRSFKLEEELVEEFSGPRYSEWTEADAGTAGSANLPGGRLVVYVRKDLDTQQEFNKTVFEPHPEDVPIKYNPKTISFDAAPVVETLGTEEDPVYVINFALIMGEVEPGHPESKMVLTQAEAKVLHQDLSNALPHRH